MTRSPAYKQALDVVDQAYISLHLARTAHNVVQVVEMDKTDVNLLRIKTKGLVRVCREFVREAATD